MQALARVSYQLSCLALRPPQVYILPATHMEFKENSAREMTTSSPLILGLKMLTFVPGSDDPVLYTDCSDVPIKVTLSDYKNFEVETNKSEH